MGLGPILARELTVTARRWRTYSVRMVFGLSLLAVFGSPYLMWAQDGALTIRRISIFTLSTFLFICLVGLAITVGNVPSILSRSVASERDRRTLDGLLLTRLSNAEIVSGKFATGLFRYLSYLATTLPIMILLPLLGGIDPRLVLLSYLAMFSTAFALASLSILISVHARSVREAASQAVGLAGCWVLVPIIAIPFLPMLVRYLGWIARAVLVPLNNLLIDSSPLGVLLNAAGFRGLRDLPGSILHMMAYQVPAGLIFLLLAIARLRKASRMLAGGDGGLLGRRQPWRWRIFPMPPCGENPVLWRERSFSPLQGMAKLVNLIVWLAICSLGLYGLYYFSRPAFIELWQEGYGGGPRFAREQFHIFLRMITLVVSFITVLIAAGYGAESIANERMKDTWLSLIATPLSGHEIIRGKILGVLWRVRAGWFGLLFAWTVGMLAGSIHPLGLVFASAVVLCASIFGASFGTYFSLASKDRGQASNWTLLPILLVQMSGFLMFLPPRYASVLLGAPSIPLATFLSLASSEEIGSLLHLGGQLPAALPTGEGPVYALAAVLLNISLYTAGAYIFLRMAEHRFDEFADRPRRTLRGPSRRFRQHKISSGNGPAGELATLSEPA